MTSARTPPWWHDPHAARARPSCRCTADVTRRTQSHGDFGTSTGPGTDLHHLRPTDVSVNGRRGNLDFDNGGSSVAQCGGCRADGDSSEPPNAVKGDVARMVLYMALSYDGGDGFADLEPNNSVDNGSRPAIGRLSVLLTWSAQDPPSTFERRRNDIIYDKYQHNRNPFIDHPEWVEELYGWDRRGRRPRCPPGPGGRKVLSRATPPAPGPKDLSPHTSAEANHP